ncbi:MAG: class I SAM-dependent methyltransferase [Bacteroidia bacterium]|nr:class I SAM-dependent methyltransferase [Bacteroidia bacterium]
MASYFDTIGSTYQAARPDYPPLLFAWIAQQAPATDCVWEPGCGSGQATLELAKHFQLVIATDTSISQLKAAPTHPRVLYRYEPAENPSLPPHTVSAIVVAQAYHWFHPLLFWQAAQKVAKPGAIIALIGYGKCSSQHPLIDSFLAELYRETEPFWPPERHHVDNRYTNLPFPVREISIPPEIRHLSIQKQWNLSHLFAYIESWSVWQKWPEGKSLLQHRKECIRLKIAQVETFELTWPLFLRAGYL